MIWKCTVAMLYNLVSTERDLQQDTQSVNSWLCVNLLTLNIRKFIVLLTGSCQRLRNHDLCINVGGNYKQLSHVSSVKYLGLHIDEKLSWHQHTANVVQRIYSRMHCLNHLRPLPIELLAKLYYIVFLCYPFWIIVMWYGHHHLCSTLNIWRGFIRGLIVHHLTWIFQHA